MSSLEGLRQGDEVRVFDVNGRVMGQPEGGWVRRVQKVGRSLVHVESVAGRGSDSYRIKDGRANDRWEHRHIETLEQYEKRAKAEAVRAVLWSVGLDSHRSKLSEGHLQAIAELVQSFGGSDVR